MKIMVILILFFAFITLFAQTGYVWERYTFNATGGVQSGTIYTSVSSFGNKVQGDISSTNYNGYLGFLFPQLDQRIPSITSIDDVPNDQGHQVQLVWNKCGFDDIYQYDTYYSVWRRDDDFVRSNEQYDIIFKKQKAKSKKYLKKKAVNILSNPTAIVELARQNPDDIYYWQRDRDRELWTFISEVPALQYESYSLMAPTLQDSSVSGNNYVTLKVVYHDLYEYYEAVPDSGYSVDNIAPQDTRVFIAQNGNNVKLNWNEVEYGMFEGNLYPELNGVWYKIYSSDNSSFVCDGTTYLTTSTDLEFDYSVLGRSKQFFKVVVSDQP